MRLFFEVIKPDEKTGGFGRIIIKNLYFPLGKELDPLGRLWSNVRRHIFKAFGVDSTAIFHYNEYSYSIVCDFYVNVGILDDKADNDTKEAYLEKFRTSFDEQAKIFQEVVEKFKTAEKNGYEDYKNLLDVPMDKSEYKKPSDNLLKAFLTDIGMRHPNPHKTDEPSKKGHTPPRGHKKA